MFLASCMQRRRRRCCARRCCPPAFFLLPAAGAEDDVVVMLSLPAVATPPTRGLVGPLRRLLQAIQNRGLPPPADEAAVVASRGLLLHRLLLLPGLAGRPRRRHRLGRPTAASPSTASSSRLQIRAKIQSAMSDTPK